jgi:hypothetical protein
MAESSNSIGSTTTQDADATNHKKYMGASIAVTDGRLEKLPISPDVKNSMELNKFKSMEYEQQKKAPHIQMLLKSANSKKVIKSGIGDTAMGGKAVFSKTRRKSKVNLNGGSAILPPQPQPMGYYLTVKRVARQYQII